MDDFTRSVASAFKSLYDFVALSRHAIGLELGLEAYSPDERAQQLRRILLEAIQYLRPAHDVPREAVDWRLHQILRLRYIEGLTANDAMGKLGLQRSQFFLYQRRALEAAAEHMRRLCLSGEQAGPSPEIEAPSGGDPVYSEAERLYEGASTEDIAVGPLLAELGSVLEPLARSRQAQLTIRRDPACTIRGSRVPLRQAILHAASYALDLFPGGDLRILPYQTDRACGVLVHANAVGTDAVFRADANDQELRLGIVQQLLAMMGAKLQIRHRRNAWDAWLLWQEPDSPVLLVVDDNRGFVDLLTRFLVGHNWRVVGAAPETNLLALIAETRPTVIILDVLMPERDGWETIVSLKANELCQDVPVIVCSVLREAQMALSLGATSYLSKPVTEQTLLQALAPWSSLIPSRH